LYGPADWSLGKMSMTIPPFVKLEYDEAARKAYVSVEDREVKKQREMWGMKSAL
jgi:large subunit ribosomal protein L6